MAQNDEHEKVEFILSPQTYFKMVALIIGTILILGILRVTAHALLIIGTAFFLALALNAPVSLLARHMPGKIKGNRAWATSLAFLLVIILLGIFIGSLVPPLVKQTESFINSVPKMLQSVHDQNSTLGHLVRQYHLQDQVSNLSQELASRAKSISGKAFDTVKFVGSSIFTLLTVLALTFMMLVEGPKQLEFLHELVPRRHRGTAKRLAADMYRVVKGYVNGQVTLAALAALLITPALFLLHISYPVGLAVVVFVCGLIPMIGHTLGAIIVTLVALFTSPTAAIIILAYYILYQQIENYLIQPRIQANSTDMSPLLVFASVVVGVSFSGLFGGLVAIPIAGCLRVALLEYLRSKNLIGAPVVKEEIKEATAQTTK